MLFFVSGEAVWVLFGRCFDLGKRMLGFGSNDAWNWVKECMDFRQSALW